MKSKSMFILLWIIVLAAIGAVVMLLWNFLMPGIFGMATINYWQAAGLFILARIVFGGFGRGSMMGGMWHGHKNPIHEKWKKMTPEQQKEFINRRRQFGFGHPFGMERFGMKEHGEHGNEDK
ncbi:MAG: DUF3106 domain-containing protein [Tannerellaceae bacterium]|jgi:hypothetical protein|nr:DUF3106 domain-containing protein [Tannerellaceae bacterium]